MTGVQTCALPISNAQRQLYSSAYHRYREVYYALKPVFEKVEI